jgi:hypothetical protein
MMRTRPEPFVLRGLVHRDRGAREPSGWLASTRILDQLPRVCVRARRFAGGGDVFRPGAFQHIFGSGDLF